MMDSIPKIQDITGWLPTGPGRQLVCVQGLGFVGAAMAAAVAAAKRPNGTLWFDVVGVDLDTPDGRERVGAINRGELPFPTTDLKLVKTTAEAHGAARNVCANRRARAGAHPRVTRPPRGSPSSGARLRTRHAGRPLSRLHRELLARLCRTHRRGCGCL